MTLKYLVRSLPRSHFETLRFLLRHLSRVAQKSGVNKMEPSNLAIVFGPTLMRAQGDDIAVAAVMNMGTQNSVIENLLIQIDWIFDQEWGEDPPGDDSSTI